MNILQRQLSICVVAIGIACAISSRPLYSQTAGDQLKPNLDAWQTHVEMAEDSRFRELPWQRLGPKFAGGRIESVDCTPGQLGTIYVGVGAGGIWKTENGGLTWRAIFENESTFAIGDLAVSPSNPNVIWVGTGECHLSGTSYAGTGIFKSTDAGQSWSNMGLHESAHIGSVVIDPEDPDTVYVAAMGRRERSGGGQRGIYKTTDGGKTFERVLFENDKVAFVDLVIDPNDSSRLYATAWDRGGGDLSGVYRSNDRGENWERLEDGLLESPAGRVAVAVSASEPGVVYALMTDRSSPNLAKRRNASVLFRSEDHGESWQRTHEDYVPTYVGWDFCDLRVAPDDADRVYIGGLRLITSSDGGQTYEGEGGFAINERTDEVFRLHDHVGTGMHLDVHEIWLDPENPERVILGNDGGLYVSWDRGETWLHLNNLPIAEFYRVHVDDQQPARVWGGTQDNASLVAPVTARHWPGVDDSWQHVFLDPWSGGDGFSTFPDPNDPETTFYTQQNGDLKRSRLGRLRAEKRIRPKGGEDETELRFAWDTPFTASSHLGPTVLYCAAQRVLRSEDRGDTWKAISPDLIERGLDAFSESPLDAKRLVAGGGRGQIFVTHDGGDNWSSVGNGLTAKPVRDVVASPHDTERLYAVLSGKNESDPVAYLYRSDDFGDSWQSIGDALPQESVNVLIEDPKLDGLVFVGTDLGAYASLDGGETWESLGHTLPTAPVVDLAIQPRDGLLIAATHGLSMFLLEIEPIRAACRSENKSKTAK